MTQDANRRAFSIGIVSAGALAAVGFPQSALAAKRRDITDQSLKSGSLTINLKEPTLYKVTVKRANRSKLVLSGKGKTATLAKWLEAGRKAGFKPARNQPILLTGDPKLFPGISKEDALKVARLNASSIHKVDNLAAKGGWYYMCGIFWYGCIEF